MHMLHHTPSQELTEQLRKAYPEAVLPGPVFDRLVGEPKTAFISDDVGVIPYVRPNPGASRPLMYLPGFGESIANKLPFAAELLSQGYDVILPGQNRTAHVGHRVPSDIQAENYESVLVGEHLTKAPVDFMAHSYGAYVLDAMVQRKPTAFAESTVFLLAPAGVGDEHSYHGHNAAQRWLETRASELHKHKDRQDFPDHTGEMRRATVAVLARNAMRAKAEVEEMKHRKISLLTLGVRVGHLVVVAYVEDKMHPQDFLVSTDEFAMKLRLNLSHTTWLSPISLQLMRDGTIRGGRGAVHNDEQFNPSRVAGAIDQILRPKPLPV